jgi:hypothetical protein
MQRYQYIQRALVVSMFFVVLEHISKMVDFVSKTKIKL